jgi:mandelate racemase
MSTTTATIRSVKARAVVAPISRPVKNAFGVIEAASLVLIDVVTDQGVLAEGETRWRGMTGLSQ